MSMVVDSVVHKEEVSVVLRKVIFCSSLFPQIPWIPQLEALFEDVKQIAPGNTFEVIG